ncbi:MAG TPA: hypothetical protein VLR70_11900 [Arthrobacter sp.]|nr:hypothetical protein [Arthrobacter sp.]
MTGSGKSSAATAYAQATGLAEFSADDDIGWLRGWTIRAGFRWLSLARLVRRSLRRALTREPVCNDNRETLARFFVQDSIIGWHFRSFTRKRQVMRSLHSDPAMPPAVLFRHPRQPDAWLAELSAMGAESGRAKSL